MPHVPNIRIRTRNRNGNKRLYLDYYVEGRRKREFLGPDTKAMRRLALKIRVQRQYEIAQGIYSDPRAQRRIRFRDFAKEYVDIHVSKLRSRARVEGGLKHLETHFGSLFLDEITRDRIESYQTRRMQDRGKKTGRPLRPATVNRELANGISLYRKTKRVPFPGRI